MRGFVELPLLIGAVLLLFSWSVILYPNIYQPLREMGLPIPYCYSEKLAVDCRYTTDVGMGQYSTVLSGDPVYASFPYPASSELYNQICNKSMHGANILAIVSNVADLDDFAENLVSCGVKVRRLPAVTFVLASEKGVIMGTEYGRLFTTCSDVVESYLKAFERRWKGA